MGVAGGGRWGGELTRRRRSEVDFSFSGPPLPLKVTCSPRPQSMCSWVPEFDQRTVSLASVIGHCRGGETVNSWIV